jgi:alpha-tubulin suppressor-like RCC1 family protein
MVTSSPLVVYGQFQADEVAVGLNHTLARVGDALYGWGNDYSGQVNGTFSEVLRPTRIDIDGDPPPAKRLVVGSGASGVIGEDGSLTMWGSGFRGDGSDTRGYEPDKVPVGSVIDVSIGQGIAATQTICVIDASRAVLCWGADTHGQLGNGDPLAEVKTPEAIRFEE